MNVRHPLVVVSTTVQRFLGAALLSAIIGCGGSPVRQIQGVVTLDGQPLESGEIQFTPTAGSVGPTAGSSISNGKYVVPAVEQGVRAGGEYRVSITSMAASGRMAPDPNSPTGQRELLENIVPDRYSTGSTLSITVASSSSDNTFDFPLTTSSAE
ncbi:hypothetical protein [Botrimarina mediterranea]|uniref:hypothetical protein n=1 Tax=Botrimarina mediterranea TaxID=2528022 RepID=UPI0011A505C2|nr:hypothetical protein [Botrimarina mediterranea]